MLVHGRTLAAGRAVQDRLAHAGGGGLRAGRAHLQLIQLVAVDDRTGR
jgi:hypothetical protein